MTKKITVTEKWGGIGSPYSNPIIAEFFYAWAVEQTNISFNNFIDKFNKQYNVLLEYNPDTYMMTLTTTEYQSFLFTLQCQQQQ